MSAVDELTDALIVAGLTPGQAAVLLGRAIAEIATPRRSPGAIRTERWRDKRASQSVTERHTVTPETSPDEASPTVTERHKASQCDMAPIDTSLNSDSRESTNEEERLEAPRSKKASRISVDWQLDQRHVDYAISKGVAPERIPILGEKFKTHWLAASGKGSVSPNWFLKWCTWVMNEVEWNGNHANGQRSNGNRSYPASGAGQSGSDAVLAGVAAAVNRRARERGQGGEPADAPGDAEFVDAKLI